MLGRGAADGEWTISSDPAANTPIRLEHGGRTTRIFLAANDYVASTMVQNGHIDLESEDTVVLLSASIKARIARFPAGKYGRDGKPKLREVCMSTVIGDATDAADLLESFKRSASL